MKTIGFILVAVALAFTIEAHAQEPGKWNTTDKVLLGTYYAASAIDAAQTMSAMRQKWPDGSPKYTEANPLLGDHPSDAAIIGTKMLFGAGLYYLADRMPEQRRLFLILANTIQISVVAHNASIGLKFGF